MGSTFSIKNDITYDAGHWSKIADGYCLATKIWDSGVTPVATLEECQDLCTKYFNEECGYVSFKKRRGADLTAKGNCVVYNKASECDKSGRQVVYTPGDFADIPADRQKTLHQLQGFQGGPVWVHCEGHWNLFVKLLFTALGLGAVAAGTVATLGVVTAPVVIISTLTGALCVGQWMVDEAPPMDYARQKEKYDAMTAATSKYTKVMPGEKYYFPRDSGYRTVDATRPDETATLSLLQRCTVVRNDKSVKKAEAWTAWNKGGEYEYRVEGKWRKGRRRTTTTPSDMAPDEYPAPTSWMASRNAHQLSVRVSAWLSMSSGWDEKKCTGELPGCMDCMRCVLCLMDPDDRLRGGVTAQECDQCASGCSSCQEDVPCLINKIPSCQYSNVDKQGLYDCLDDCNGCIQVATEVFGGLAEAACERCNRCEALMVRATMCMIRHARTLAPYVKKGVLVRTRMNMLKRGNFEPGADIRVDRQGGYGTAPRGRPMGREEREVWAQRG